MNYSYRNYTIWIYSVLSLVVILGVVLGSTTSMFGNELSLAESLILSLLGVILGALAFDNWANSNRIHLSITQLKEDNDKILKALGDNNIYRIVLGQDRISEEVNEEVKKAKKSIKATSFQHIAVEDRANQHYYELVATQVRDENIVYRTVYNHLTSLSDRRKAFVTSGIVQSNKRDRIQHFVSKTKQIYLNVLIIDKRVAFIGFPTYESDKHMQTVLKVSNNSLEGTEFIDNLYEWYDHFVIKNSVEQKFEDIFK